MDVQRRSVRKLGCTIKEPVDSPMGGHTEKYSDTGRTKPVHLVGCRDLTQAPTVRKTAASAAETLYSALGDAYLFVAVPRANILATHCERAMHGVRRDSRFVARSTTL